MLKVENLTKIYRTGNNEVEALKNISFTLEDKGFVFITGKSGCGKSTLLNMLGGLDNLTSGNIICDGNDLSKFTNSDFDKYRNTYLGFVFQDYCLIEELSVQQNIELSLDIKGAELTHSEKEKLVNEALLNVDLDINIKNRKIKQLSGGQKQRVAIARALVKNPRLILADEPTGNLDSKTSHIILNVLKKLSQNRLVIIVSHNKEDAKKYANRIIELADGQIKSDTTRKANVEDKMCLNRGVLNLPTSTTLTPSELKIINEQLKHQKIKKIRQNSSGFVKTKNLEYDFKYIDIEPRNMKIKSSFGIANFFIRKRWFASLATIFVISLLVFILGLCQFFIQFNESKTVIDVLAENEETDLLVYKGYYNEDGEIENNKFIKISDEEIQGFYDAGYTGNIYPLYLQPFETDNDGCYAISGEMISPWKNINQIYIKETMGTLNCDEEYLIDRFGVEGNLNVLAGNINDTSSGVIITDYMADSLIALSKDSNYVVKSYDECVGQMVMNRCYVNAVIKTDYKEKYKDLFEYIKDLEFGIDRSEDKEYFKLKTHQFMADIQKYYGLAYSISSNFEYDIFTISNTTYAIANYVKLSTVGYSNSKQMLSFYLDESFKENEIALEYDIFNYNFGRIYGYYTEENYQNFEPITLTLTKYNGNEESEVLYSKEIKITKLLDDDYFYWTKQNDDAYVAGEELMNFIRSNSMYIYGLYFDNTSSLSSIYDVLNNNPYIINSDIYKSISTVGDVVKVFNDIFGLILLGIGGASMILLISYAFGNIKKRYYEIGVLKALGTTTKNVGFIFSLQTILAGICICIFSTLLLLTLTNPINSTISNELLKFVSNNELGPLAILKVNVPTLIINALIIVVVTTLSCIIPLLKLHKIKPKNIIANKD